MNPNFYTYTICFFLLIFSCTNEKSSKNLAKSTNNSLDSNSLNIDVEEEAQIDTTERKAYFSKHKIKNIRLVSYKVDTSGSSDSYMYPFEINNSELGTKLFLNKFAEILILNKGQKNEFQNILSTIKSKEPFYSSDCYIPHHCFHILDEDDILIDYLEVCFMCNGFKASNDNLSILTFEQLKRLDIFIKHCGVKMGFK